MYTSDQNNVEIEIVYTSGQTDVEIEKVYTSAQIHDFRTIKGKHSFAIYFPNVDCLMIKGKQFFAIYFPNVDILMIKGKHFLLNLIKVINMVCWFIPLINKRETAI